MNLQMRLQQCLPSVDKLYNLGARQFQHETTE